MASDRKIEDGVSVFVKLIEVLVLVVLGGGFDLASVRRFVFNPKGRLADA